MTYLNWIKKADKEELIDSYEKAIMYLQIALEYKQKGSITKKMLRERITELKDKL